MALLLLPILGSGGSTAQSSLDWLVGCWVSEDKSSQEVWVVDSEKSLIGFGVAISSNQLAFYEILSIKQNAGGMWTYTAHPSGQASATFTAIEASENSVEFVNPGHDYPQEIRYQRDGNQLHARISLLDGDEPNTFDKMPCDQLQE